MEVSKGASAGRPTALEAGCRADVSEQRGSSKWWRGHSATESGLRSHQRVSGGGPSRGGLAMPGVVGSETSDPDYSTSRVGRKPAIRAA